MALRTLLLSDAAVASAVGQRIYPQVATQGANLPRIVYQAIGDQSARGLSGPLGQTRSRYQIRIDAADPDSLRELGDRIKTILDGFAGQIADRHFDSIEHVDGSDRTEPPKSGERNPAFVRWLDFYLWHEELTVNR